IQRQAKAALGDIFNRLDHRAAMLGIGVGVHTGQVEIGEFSSVRSDFTAIGGAVNLAARLEAHADAGEILVSAETAAKALALTVGAPTRTLILKGIEQPVPAHVLSAGS